MKNLVVFSGLLFLCLLSFSCNKIDASLCSRYNVYYNGNLHYYLVSYKNTPSASFYVWETNKGFYLVKAGGKYYDVGPYDTIEDAIHAEMAQPFYKVLTYSEHRKSGNTLVRREDGTELANLCD